MQQLGFIGTGSMGSILLESFIKAGIPEEMIHVTNRSVEKVRNIKTKFKHVSDHSSSRSLADSAEWIFVCTKPADMVGVLKDMSTYLKSHHVIITITSPLQVEEAEELLYKTKTPVVRFIPSIVNLSLQGPSLVTFGNRCSNRLQNELNQLFNLISSPISITADMTRAASDLASCGPAFISFLVRQMIKGAVEETGIKEGTALKITESMLVAYGELLRGKQFDLATLQKRVTVPGGVTGVGLDVLEKNTKNTFHDMFKATHKKYANDRDHIRELLNK
ncbi:late competence protein ComER [Salipaludibacillus agaradhaerens]|uniref:Late competence protein ComER n=2 Tax=Salipaludibacillus agaradhaerens TaxID=76935 RepID=A0A9Q4FYY7_SALAG|nr:late competence protein ComER [Salipaludibacillus agaradhaerens]MCR6096811.1 late competence protein ComER [Salipaludibacillus agaradhaerens]MCR6113630.1 late competence protein ComER [Salipaludibacillus agaradhaerens]